MIFWESYVKLTFLVLHYVEGYPYHICKNHEYEKTYGSFEENDDIHELSKICILFPYLYVRKK